eukprot:CCRYP_013376-RA/>CCRYP_013376-RA protein AED:0.45 eAED:0.45 QI:0/-1/0/1/-1/0/1/0/96
MFVNGLPFFVTVSRGNKLISVVFLPSHMAKQVHTSLDTVARLYQRGGFLVKMCLMDMEFKPLEAPSTDCQSTLLWQGSTLGMWSVISGSSRTVAAL